MNQRAQELHLEPLEDHPFEGLRLPRTGDRGRLGVVGDSRGGSMKLRLSDSSYTDRLATFLRSLGQTVFLGGPGELEVATASLSAEREVEIYLRVWRVLYPDADVQPESAEGAAADA